VFVFFVTLSSLDDAKLLEDTLKTEFRVFCREGTQEYLRLEFPREMFKGLQAQTG
jgi:hypothetical protein